MKTYNVIVRTMATATDEIIGEVMASNQAEAKKQAVAQYLGRWNMIRQQILVARKEG